MFLTGLDIQILFKTYTGEADQILDELKPNKPYKEYDRRVMTFYHISSIAPHYDRDDNNKLYTQIFSNGTEYIAPFEPDQVKEAINRHLATTSMIYSKN